MSFPWKKSKITRISRIVAAGLNKTPKRGGSLVVETGFPTSLIDLFVKNRDRLRRSSKRKPDPQIILPDPTRSYSSPPCNHQEVKMQSDDNTTRPDPHIILPDPNRSYSSSPCNQEIQMQSADNTTRPDPKIELHLVFKIFSIVALSVCTGNLTVWIMMVVFSFVGSELFGSRFSGFLKSGSNELILERVELERVERELTELIELENGLKIETVLTSKQQGCERTRSARIKSSLIKKFVPKKLRSRNKKDQVEETESETELVMIPTSDKNDEISRSSEKPKNLSVILFVVVILAGLIGGKGFALLLTLLCCLMIPVYFRTRKCYADLNIECKTR